MRPTSRRNLAIQAKLRSTTQRPGSNTKPRLRLALDGPPDGQVAEVSSNGVDVAFHNVRYKILKKCMLRRPRMGTTASLGAGGRCCVGYACKRRKLWQGVTIVDGLLVIVALLTLFL